MTTEKTEGISTWLKRLKHPHRKLTTYSRLCSSLITFEVMFDATKKRKHAENSEWATGVSQLIQDIKLYKNKHDMDAAWRLLDAANQLMIFGFDQNELNNEAIVLRHEAQEYESSKKEAVYELIGKPEQQRARDIHPIDVNRLDKAVSLRNASRAAYYKAIDNRRRNLKIVMWILTAALIAIPLLAMFRFMPEPFVEWKRLIGVELFGILGAGFTTAITLTKSSLGDKIPDQVISVFITGLRSLIGASAALASYAFLNAKILDNVISSTVTESFAGLLAVAFIAGFSERFVIKAISELPRPEEQKEVKA